MSPFDDFARKMSAEGLPEIVIRTFQHSYEQLASGVTGMIPESDITPLQPSDIADYTSLGSYAEDGAKALARSAVVKLNGGLGTSMGLAMAKSLIEVRGTNTFLDCAVMHMRAVRRRYNAQIPFLLMNSFSTDDASVRRLERYPDNDVGLPLRFLQHKYPKILRETLSPATWPQEPSLEWNPPGHGDIYPALITSDVLRQLRERGVRYVFISNSDNLGASLDVRILGYFARNDIPFLMEVAGRTAMDRKGGHIARHRNGRIVLRESAQCPEQDMQTFQDTQCHQFFNTNNLWLNLDALELALREHGGVLPLPLIVNPKRLDPRKESSPEVYQLETAMGAAIGVFNDAAAVLVPRERFVPVKKCSDLLVVWSDRYMLNDDFLLVQHADSTADITVDLDPLHYSKFDDFKTRFPHGAPSLRRCTSLSVRGDVKFLKSVQIEGAATVTNRGSAQAVIAQGATVTGNVTVG